MKKTILVFMIIASILSFSCANNSNESSSDPTFTAVKAAVNPDFRNTNWGDSPETVIARETAESYNNGTLILPDNYLVYKSKINSLDTNITYYFDSSQRLYRAEYGITEDHGYSAQLYISNYESLKNLLIEKYGVPYEDEVLILNHLAEYTDDATALNMGYTAYVTKWKTDTTEIMLAMMCGSGGTISLAIFYSSIEFASETDLSDF